MRNKNSITQNKFLIFLIFFAALLFLSFTFTSALEVKISGLSDSSSLGDYVSVIFTWVMGIAGTITLISFIVGAVGLIISGDNPTLHGDSIDRIKGAILGLVLIMASFLILKTINPAFVNPTLTPLPPGPTIAVPIIPGVYYYTEAGCAGDSSGPNTYSQNAIDSAFAGKIKSVKIINDVKNYLGYGAIFHQESGLENGGGCTAPITTEGCQKVVGVEPFAVDIFQLNAHPSLSGSGVVFYSEAYGWNTGINAGSFLEKGGPDGPISGPIHLAPAQMSFDYSKVNRPDTYMHKCSSSSASTGSPGNRDGVDCSKNACETFEDCAGAIKINGSYLVALYSQNTRAGVALYCQTFTKDVENLDAEQIVAGGTEMGEKLSDIYIVPTN